VTGRHVVMVDFSYKRDVLLKMAEKSAHILILDHHKTAEADLVDLPANVECVFDMNRSGPNVAWDRYFPNQRPPKLIEHALMPGTRPDISSRIAPNAGPYPTGCRLRRVISGGTGGQIVEIERHIIAVDIDLKNAVDRIAQRASIYMNLDAAALGGGFGPALVQLLPIPERLAVPENEGGVQTMGGQP
jgi:hypothetical protein